MVLIAANITICSDIYFIGGFGTVQWVDVKEYETLQPDKIAAVGGEQNLKVSSRSYISCIKTYCSICLFIDVDFRVYKV